MNHLGIKNLSIALEALSRICTYDAMDAATKIRELLDAEINEAKEHNRFAAQAQKPPTPNTDDEIPF